MLQARPTNLATSDGYYSPSSGVRGAAPTPISPRPARGQRHPTHCSGGRINQRPRRRQTRKMNRNNTEYNQIRGEGLRLRLPRTPEGGALRKPTWCPPERQQYRHRVSQPAQQRRSSWSHGSLLLLLCRGFAPFRSEPAAGLPRFSDHADPPVAPLAHYSESLTRSVSGFVFETCPRSPGKAARQRKSVDLESRKNSGAS